MKLKFQQADSHIDHFVMHTTNQSKQCNKGLPQFSAESKVPRLE